MHNNISFHKSTAAFVLFDYPKVQSAVGFIKLAIKKLGMKNFVAILLIAFLTQTSFSQSYNTAGGARLGDDFGVTLKQRIGKRTTLEGIYMGGLISNDYNAGVLVEQHFPLISKRFNFYLGAGIGSRWNHIENTDKEFIQHYSVPMTFGLEFTIGRLNLSADVMPHFIMDKTVDKRFVSGSAFSLRYVFVKRKREKKDGVFKKIGDAFPKRNKDKGKKNKKDSNKKERKPLFKKKS